MARTVTEIKNVMTTRFIEYPSVSVIYELESGKTFDEQFSKASIESILFYVFAYTAWVIECLFDKHLADVDDKIRNQRPHTKGWYRTMALNFQFGGVLKDDITEYDNTGLTPEEIAAQKIVTKCAITPSGADKPTLLVKVLKASGKLNADEKTAFSAYIDAVADAGLNIETISEDADRLILFVTIRYDSMVMNAKGIRFSDGKEPVKIGIPQHLDNLQFNGTFFPSLMEQDLMQQSGIRVATIRLAQAAAAGHTPQDIVDKYEPYSGAILIDVVNDLHVTYERF